MFNNSIALHKFYQGTSALGDGFFATAVHNYIYSEETRARTRPLILAGVISKFISLIPFYLDKEIKNNKPHPISGMSHPGMPGVISASAIAILPKAEVVSQLVSFAAGLAQSFLGHTVVYETPSTFFRASQVCIPPPKDDPFYCETSNNITESNLHRNRTHFPPNCTMSRCIATRYPIISWLRRRVWWAAMGVMALHDIGLMIATFRLREYKVRPLRDQIASTNGLLEKIKILVTHLTYFLPIFGHLVALKTIASYRWVYLTLYGLPLTNIPFILAAIFNSHRLRVSPRTPKAEALFLTFSAVYAVFNTFLIFGSGIISKAPPDVPSPQEIPDERT